MTPAEESEFRRPFQDRAVLCITGDRDSAYRFDFISRLKPVLRNARYVVLENTGHFAPEDNPEGVAAEILRRADEPRAG